MIRSPLLAVVIIIVRNLALIALAVAGAAAMFAGIQLACQAHIEPSAVGPALSVLGAWAWDRSFVMARGVLFKSLVAVPLLLVLVVYGAVLSLSVGSGIWGWYELICILTVGVLCIVAIKRVRRWVVE